MNLDALLGPLGLTVALIAAVGFLARVLFKYIDRIIAGLEARIVDLTSQRDIAVAGWREQTTATNRVADALEATNRAAARRRTS